ncbi:MEI2-like 2 protein [Nymphaea thermarum]|nr:MEI2-like 2 protein [Nymphaea thermarum]
MAESSGLSSQGLGRVFSMRIPQKVGNTTWGVQSKSEKYQVADDTSLFSMNFESLDKHVEAMGTASSNSNQVFSERENKESTEDIDHDPVELPDDENELLAGIMDDFDLTGLPSNIDDVDDYDLFGSGGGMELDFEPQESLSLSFAKASISDNYVGNATGQYGLSNGVGTVAGEHPYGEHPSRTLFVRNINSNVEDSELRSLFEQFGAIRTLYTACKHRGFVMISYYDIRDARTAMRALQNKPLRRRKLDIHFSIPKDNPSEKDINQGTLVVFNLDPSVSNDDLRQIFGAYGEIKEIRETPHKRHHKFIEFYDVRAAEAALRSLNRSDIAGKKIKLEPSRPGGARRNLMHQLTQDLDQDEARTFRPPGGSPIGNSPPGTWASYSPNENSLLHASNQSPGVGTISPIGSNHLPGLASILPPLMSNTVKIAPIGKDQGRGSHTEQVFSSRTSITETGIQQSHSFPESGNTVMPNMGQSPGSLTSFGLTSSNASGVGTLSGPQFLWGSSTPYSSHTHSSAWPAPSAGRSFTSTGQGPGYPYSSRQGSFMSSSHQHHVGSAPSGIPFERQYGFFPDSPETSFINAAAFGGVGLNRNDGSYLMNIGGRTAINSGISLSNNMMPENGSPNFRVLPSQRLGHMILGNSPFAGPFTSIDGIADRGRSRRVENNVNQLDNKKQYQLDLEKIESGEDTRTTLMIKNIPNKYTSKMLLAAIDENHKGTYDFLYLPIDFKNKCNVGYAFINMVSPSYIIPFYEAFNGKKWEKFNSEKVASLAYARIQGKAALVTHFQNSSLMNEDKRCRPILFHSDGSEAGDQEPFPLTNVNMRPRPLDASSPNSLSESPTTVWGSEKTEKNDG